MTEIYIALIYVAIVGFMILAGINGIRYARILRLDWPIYAESLGWLAVGTFSLIGMFIAIYTGVPDMFKVIGVRAWIGVGLWFAFTASVAIGKSIAVRNVKRKTAAEQQAAADLHNAIFKLGRTIRGKHG